MSNQVTLNRQGRANRASQRLSSTVPLTDVVKPRIVIIGGGYAGVAAALRLARHSQAEIHLVNPSSRFVERIRLHQAAAGERLPTIELAQLLRGLDIVLHLARAEEIDYLTQQVGLDNGITLPYERLIYALGSQIAFHTPGAQAHALALAGIDASARIERRLDQLASGSRVVVVGAGLTGIELATELAEIYPHLVWSIIARSAFDADYAPGARDYLLAALAQRGVQLRTGVTVLEVASDHLRTDQGEVPFDLCLWGASFTAPALGRRSGLRVNERNQLLVDETLRSLTVPEIYVAGDSAALPDDYRPVVEMGCKTAMPMGFQVADNLLAEMAGQPLRAFRYAYQATCVSLGRRDGLIQARNADGSPSARFVTGWLGSWIKEWICRFTVIVLRVERYMNVYDWFMPAAQIAPSQKPSTQSTDRPQAETVLSRGSFQR